MIKELSQTFHIYALDLPGMGLSSRPDFNYETTEEAINFFVESIEHWRKAIDVDYFSLLGHSFGGYMACQYAAKYQENIKRLYLVSPLGVSKITEDTNSEEEKFRNRGFISRQIVKIEDKYFFQDKLTLHALFKKFYYLRYAFKVVSRWKYNVKKSTADDIFEFLAETYKFNESSEKALHLIVDHNYHAYLPLEDIIINQISIPINLYYGDKDWMCDKGAKRIQETEKENYQLIYVPDSGHNINMDNANELVHSIVQSCF